MISHYKAELQTVESFSNFRVMSYFTLICGRHYNNQRDLVHNWNRFRIHLYFSRLRRIFVLEWHYPRFLLCQINSACKIRRDGRRFTINVSNKRRCQRLADQKPPTAARENTKRRWGHLFCRHRGVRRVKWKTTKWRKIGCCGSETRRTRLNSTCLKLFCQTFTGSWMHQFVCSFNAVFFFFSLFFLGLTHRWDYWGNKRWNVWWWR